MNKFKIDHLKIDYFVYILVLASVLRKVEPLPISNATDIVALSTENSVNVSTEESTIPSHTMDLGGSTYISKEVKHTTPEQKQGVTNSTLPTKPGNDTTTEDSKVKKHIIVLFGLTCVFLLLMGIICILCICKKK